MSWLPFALFSAIISGGRKTYEKKLTGHFSNFGMGFIMQTFCLLPTLALFLFMPLPEDIWRLPWQFWWPLLIIWFVLYPIQTYFLYKAIREGEIVQVSPIKAILPVFNIGTSFILLKEAPSLVGLLGILVIVYATYLLLSENISGDSGKKYNKSVIYMIIAMFCIAIGSTLDKVSLTVSTPVFYSFVNTLGASIIFLILIFIYRKKEELGKIKPRFWTLTLFGIFMALSYISTMIAFSKGPTSYVLAVQAAGFLFAVFSGAIFLKEKLSGRKILSLFLFTLGIILITVIK
mgnify:FL=1